VRGLQPARGAQLPHDRFEGLDPFGLHLDLDAPQLHGPLSAAHDDDRVVERHLGDVDTADAQREGPAAGTDLEHLAQRPRARDGAQATADGTLRPEVADAAGWHDLGHFEPLAQAIPLGGVHVLHGDFDMASAVAGTRDESGARHAPVVGVEIGVHKSPGRLRERGHRAAAVGLDGKRREGGEPAFHWPQVEGVELPLDLDRFWRAGLVCLGLGHRAHATAGAQLPARRAVIAAVRRDRDGNLRRRGATNNDGRASFSN
jgi:hypothetical protein